MRRSLVPAALLLPLALLLSACGGNSAAETSTGTDGKGSLTLNVGDQKGGSEAVLRAAGELKNLDYKIKWSTFTSGPPLLEAVNAKAVDIGAVGNTPPVFAAGAGSKIKVVAASHGNSQGEAILVPKDSKLTSPEQLKGKSIAVAQGSSAHFQLIASLKAAGLTLSDVKVKYLQPADALAAFTSGKVDAWTVWDPYTSQVLQAKQGRILTTGQGLVNGLNFQVAAPSALGTARRPRPSRTIWTAAARTGLGLRPPRRVGQGVGEGHRAAVRGGAGLGEAHERLPYLGGRRQAADRLRAADRGHLHQPEAHPAQGRLRRVRRHPLQRQPAGLDDRAARLQGEVT
jgi:ABC-type nitrate/sulfonate/bicarbonate transport system substrate-binding protein